MDPWIEVYDSPHVQASLKHQVANASLGVAAFIAVAVFSGTTAFLAGMPHAGLLLLAGAGSLTLAVFVTTRLANLECRVWCLKLSPHMVMGYNHSRTPTAFAWSSVDCISIAEASISIVAGGHTMIEISSDFADFTYVSHRILDLAELHRKPIHLKDTALPDVDIFRLLPELRQLVKGRNVAVTRKA